MNPRTRAVARVAEPVARVGRGLGRTRLTLVGWHRLGARGDGLTTSPDDFRRHLDVLEQWGARVLPLADALAAQRHGTLPERAVVLTFDDGYASVVEQAWPELQRRGMPATFFVVSDHLEPERRLPWDRTDPDAELVRLVSEGQLLEAASAGLDIGSHTRRHTWLPHRTAADLRDELVSSRARLEDLLQTPVTSVAYPAGGWDARVRDATADAGYDTGITVDRGDNTRRTDRLTLRRTFAPDVPADLRLVLDGAYTWLRPIDRFRARHGRPDLS